MALGVQISSVIAVLFRDDDERSWVVRRIVGAVVLILVMALTGPARAEGWMDSHEALKAFGQSPGGSRQAGQTKKRKSSGLKIASLGGSSSDVPMLPKRSLTGGSGKVTWLASASCLNSGLRSIVQEVASTYGPVTVNSTCRSKGHNRRVGGAPKSYHLTGDAVDFRVHANAGAVASFLKSRVGGYQNKGGGLFHIDTGPRRPMG